MTTPRRLLLVHAHPDDESIGNGATMARYAAEGVEVTLVTCTRGEQGEVIPPSLAHLAGERLGDHRVGELARAMAALGVTDHRFLGDPASPGRPARESARAYRDSGMAYDHDGGVVPAPNPPPGAFARTDPAGPAQELAALIRQLRPQVVVTYEPGGGYGHPDHVRTHLVTMQALDLAIMDGDGDGGGRPGGELGTVGVPGTGDVLGAPGWPVPKVYWSAQPESLTRAVLRTLAAAQGPDYRGPDPDGRLPGEVVPDDQVSAVIDATAYTAAKAAALRAHETQVVVTGDDAFFDLSNGVRRPVMGLEFYRLVRGEPAGPYDAEGRETDLFAGL